MSVVRLRFSISILQQFLEPLSCQALLPGISGRGCKAFGVSLDKEFVKHPSIKRIWQWQVHSTQDCWNEIVHFGIGSLKTPPDTPPVGIEHTILLVRAADPTRLAPVALA